MALGIYEEEDIQAIAETIRYEVGDNTKYKASEMANGVGMACSMQYSRGESAGYDMGRDDGYDAGYSDGASEASGDAWNDGFNVGYDQGWNEGFSTGGSGSSEAYENGYNEGFDAGYTQGYDEGQIGVGEAYGGGYNDGYGIGKVEGFDEGKKAEHNAFWDEFQSATSHFWAKYAGNGWNTKTFRPTQDLNIVDGNASYCFAYSKLRVDLEEWCKNLGVSIKIKPTVLTGLFQSSEYTAVPAIDTSLNDSLSNCFAYCSYLVTIKKLILKNAGSQTFSNTFVQCKVLENIIIEGIIANNFDIHYSPLTKASIESIMSHLSDTATFTVTLSKAAVDKAFETTPGANDGSSSEEWKAWEDDPERPSVKVVLS